MASGIFIGKNFSDASRKRIAFLEGVNRMSVEIFSLLDDPVITLYEIFSEIQKGESDKDFLLFYERLCLALGQKEGHAFEEIWREQVKLTFSEQSSEDINELQEFVTIITNDDREIRRDLYEGFRVKMAEKTEAALKEAKDKSILYEALGLGMGLILVIIMF